ncbi:MAG: bestrophin [Candidatus Accumulibacter sp.]|nr:bestrophin [Accumulibacter sp.]
MIVRPRPRGIEYFFVLRGSILPNIWIKLFTTIATAVVVTLSHGTFYHLKITLTTIPFTLMGLALAIFLGFRNSASYERFWEGRKLWGTLLGSCRNLTRQIDAFLLPAQSGNAEKLAEEQAEIAAMRRRVALAGLAFAHTLRHQLRDSSPGADLRRLLPAEEAARIGRLQRPAAGLLQGIGDDLHACLRRGWISAPLAAELDRSLSRMGDVLSACERIRNTPLPFSYAVLLHRTVYLYCYLLPFGLVDSIGALTPIVVGIVAYTFFGLDAIGDEIEEPFGTTANDLPLAALCVDIEISVREALGDRDLPRMPEPVNYCLQ